MSVYLQLHDCYNDGGTHFDGVGIAAYLVFNIVKRKILIVQDRAIRFKNLLLVSGMELPLPFRISVKLRKKSKRSTLFNAYES